MKNTLNFILDVLRTYFLGGFVGLILLLYLVLTDPYFKNLDFGNENYVVKLDKFFLFVFYIPIWILIGYGFYLLIKNKHWASKLIRLASTSIGLLLFYAFDLKIKHVLIFSSKIPLNLIVLSILYLAFIWFCVKFKR